MHPAALGRRAEARRRQTDVESILIEQYKVPKGELGVSLSQFYGCPFVEFDEKILPPPDLMKDLRLEYLRRNFWLPLRREDAAVVVLIDNPQDLQRVDNVSQALKRAASFYRQIHPSDLRASQLPPTLTDAHGTITKPPRW